jgi:hypothetical protein
MNAEEKIAQLDNTIKAVEGEPLTADMEYAILEGRGIEYKVNESFSIIVPPIRLGMWGKVIESEEKNKACKSAADVNRNTAQLIGDICGVDPVKLLDECDRNDLTNICGLMYYSYLEGKSILKKKGLTASAVLKRVEQYLKAGA